MSVRANLAGLAVMVGMWWLFGHDHDLTLVMLGGLVTPPAYRFGVWLGQKVVRHVLRKEPTPVACLLCGHKDAV